MNVNMNVNQFQPGPLPTPQPSANSNQRIKRISDNYPIISFEKTNEVLARLNSQDFIVRTSADEVSICIGVNELEGPRQYKFLPATKMNSFIDQNGETKELHEIIASFVQKGFKEKSATDHLASSYFSLHSSAVEQPQVESRQLESLPRWNTPLTLKIASSLKNNEFIFRKSSDETSLCVAVKRQNQPPTQLKYPPSANQPGKFNYNGRDKTIEEVSIELTRTYQLKEVALEELQPHPDNSAIMKNLKEIEKTVNIISSNFLLSTQQSTALYNFLAVYALREDFDEILKWPDLTKNNSMSQLIKSLLNSLDNDSTIDSTEKSFAKEAGQKLLTNTLLNQQLATVSQLVTLAVIENSNLAPEQKDEILQAFHTKAREYLNLVQQSHPITEANVKEITPDVSKALYTLKDTLLKEKLVQNEAAKAQANAQTPIAEEEPIPDEIYQKHHLPKEFKCLTGFTHREGSGYVFADNIKLVYSRENRQYREDLGMAVGNMSCGSLGDLTEAELKAAAAEYKIHLMPKDEEMGFIVDKLMNKLNTSPELKELIVQYKVAAGRVLPDGQITYLNPDARNNSHFPKVVIYTQGKENAQKVLDALLELYQDDEIKGEDITPRLNQQVNRLVYYAQFSADPKTKLKSMGKDQLLFESDLVHFKPSITLRNGAVIEGDHKLKWKMKSKI